MSVWTISISQEGRPIQGVWNGYIHSSFFYYMSMTFVMIHFRLSMTPDTPNDASAFGRGMSVTPTNEH